MTDWNGYKSTVLVRVRLRGNRVSKTSKTADTGSVNLGTLYLYVCQVGHDSSIGLADAGNGMAVMKLKTNLLPFLSVVWLAPNKLLAAGHDCVPVVFYVDSAGKRMRGTCTGTVR